MSAVISVVIGVIAVVGGDDGSHASRSDQLCQEASGLIIALCLVAAWVTVLILSVRWFGSHLRDRSRNGAAWFPGRLRYVGVGFLVGAVLGCGHLGLTAWLSPTQATGMGPVTEMATKPGLDRSLWVLMGLLVAPPVEELFFRGVVYGGFHRSWGPIWAAVVTTGVFVGLHLGEIWYFWPAALSLMAVASGTLALRLRTQAMGAPVAAHLAFNAVLAVVVYARG